MTDFSQFSNDLVREEGLDAALSDVEQALSRFERIIARHIPASQAFDSLLSRKKNKKTLINGAIRSLLDLFSSGNGRQRTVFTSNEPSANRFPSSNGQVFSDIWSSLQQFGSRNL